MSGNGLVSQAMARAFVAEGVDTVFGLMGDGNMYWMADMDAIEGVRTIGVRHEHCCALMAVGYWSATGKVGVCSVTHGPGFTQMMTALTTAARNRVPLVMFAGETSLGAAWGLQTMDQAILAQGCGAEYLAVHSQKVVNARIREAFYIARTRRKPVVLGVPLDLQREQATAIGAYRPSTELIRPQHPIAPDPGYIAALAQKLVAARNPVLVAGRGALQAGAGPAIEALGDAVGALIGTTLMGKGMFDHHPHSLGIVGGYARQAARDACADADLVIFFGAALSRFTLDGGKMFPAAEKVNVDTSPEGLVEGLAVTDESMRADARLTAEALLEAVRGLGPAQARGRTEGLAQRLANDPADPTEYELSDGGLDPRAVTDAMERAFPGDYHFVSGSAHQAYWHTTMRGSPPGHYHAIRAFGAIGNAMSFAIGVAVGRGDGRVVVFEGDGGLLMHIQELETLWRHGIKLLMVCYNDGAYGAEIHKLRIDGVDDSGAVFGRPPFAAVAKAFGLDGATVTDLDGFDDLLARYEAGDVATIWDLHVSDRVLTPPMRDEVAAMAGGGK